MLYKTKKMYILSTAQKCFKYKSATTDIEH